MTWAAIYDCADNTDGDVRCNTYLKGNKRPTIRPNSYKYISTAYLLFGDLVI
jgi:hypothetical protein